MQDHKRRGRKQRNHQEDCYSKVTVKDIQLCHWRSQWFSGPSFPRHQAGQGVRQGPQLKAESNAPSIFSPHGLFLWDLQGGLIALLILLLLLTLALYNRRGGPGSSCCLPASARHRPPMPPQKSASAEAGDEIHYIPSVLLGSHGLDSRRSNTRLLQDSHNGLGMGTGSCAVLRGGGGDEDYGSQVTRTLESLGRTERDGSYTSHNAHFVKVINPSFDLFASLPGSPRSPISKTTLALLSVTSCFLAVACGMHVACPLTVRVTLHVPEHFVADGTQWNFVSPNKPFRMMPL
uniref:Astrotactin-1/2 N-terminal domain-containing protein n=1 Tax=Eptatretus burgeri TaxID=7764 RepID=A0A8C4R0Z0_EPTBU